MKNKKDNIEKEFFKDKEIFSNLINYYLFNGENIVSPNELTELDTESNKGNISRKRDVLKLVSMQTNGKYRCVLVGIENQTRPDKNMVLRIMLYDSLSYDSQLRDIDNNLKNDKIKIGIEDDEISPVITLIIYFSHKKWRGPRDLYSLLEIDENDPISKYISNYKLNIIEPCRMNEKDFKLLNKDLSVLFEFIKNSGDENKLNHLMETNDKYKKINNKTIRLINEVTNAELPLNENEEETNMCKAIEDMKKHAREDGIAEGEARGKVEGATNTLNENIKTMYSNGFDSNTIARALSLDIEYVKKVLA